MNQPISPKQSSSSPPASSSPPDHQDTRLDEEELPRRSPHRAFPKPKAARRSSSTLSLGDGQGLWKDTDFALREVWAKHLKFKDRAVNSQPSTTHETLTTGWGCGCGASGATSLAQGGDAAQD
eukprot:Skav220943  [mRNA]  locus=scaffold2381:61646:66098:+ [translate_table: standard]